MNKKGFTLVEILVVIVLISLILGLGIPGIMKLSENMKKRSLNSKINIIESAAVVWGNDNKSLLKKTICNIDGKGYDCYKISLGTLIEEDYLSSEKAGDIIYVNPENDESLVNNCVYIYKKNNKVYSYFAKEDVSCIFTKTENDTDPEVEEITSIRIEDEEQPQDLDAYWQYTLDYSYDEIVYCDNSCVEPGNTCTKEEIKNGIYCQVITKGGYYVDPTSKAEDVVENFHVLKDSEDYLYLLHAVFLDSVKIDISGDRYKDINEVTKEWTRITENVVYQDAFGYLKSKNYNSILPTYTDLKEITSTSGEVPYFASIAYDENLGYWLDEATSANGYYEVEGDMSQCEALYNDSSYYDISGTCYDGSGDIIYGCVKGTKLIEECSYTNSTRDDIVENIRIVLPILKKSTSTNVSSKTYTINIDNYYSWLDYENLGNNMTWIKDDIEFEIDDTLWGSAYIKIKYFVYENNLYVSNIKLEKVFYNGKDIYSQPYGMECEFYNNNKKLNLNPMWNNSTIYNNVEILYKTDDNSIDMDTANITYKCYNYELKEMHSETNIKEYYIEPKIIKSGELNFN